MTNAPRLTLEDTLAAILDAQQQLVSLSERPGGERQGSIEVEMLASGKAKVTAKSYVGSVLTREMVDEHLDVYAYAVRQASQRAMDGWAETVRQLEDERSRHEGLPEHLKSWPSKPRPDTVGPFDADIDELEELPDFEPAARA